MWRSKNVVHLLVWSALAIYLVLFEPLFTRFFVTIGKPVYVGFMDQSETAMDLNIDQLSEVRYAGQDVHQLTGWAIPRDGMLSLKEYDKQVVLIDSQARGYVFAAQTVDRYDVADAYRGLAEDLDFAGFSAYISKRALPAGPYRIGVLFAPRNASSIFHLTDTYLVRTPNTLRLVESYTALDDTSDDWIQKVRLRAGLQGQSEMAYDFDRLQVVSQDAEAVYLLEGWAFPWADDRPLKEYRKRIVLVDERSIPHLLDADTVRRPDVNEALADSGRDVDFSGFSARLPTSILPPGLYRLGFLYTDRNSASVYHLTTTSLLRTGSVLQLVKPSSALDDSLDDWIHKVRLLAGLQVDAEMAYGFDRLLIVSQGAEEVYQLEGWGFPWAGDLPLNEYRKRIVLLDERSIPHLLDAETARRPDVQEAFAVLGRDVEFSGFSARLSTSILPAGLYRLGLLYTDRYSGSVYYLTTTSLLRTASALQLVKSSSALDDSHDDWIEKARLLAGPQGQSEMAYNFDRLQIVSRGSQDLYQLDGWAFPWVGDRPLAKYRKRIVLLDKRSLPHLVDAESARRPDVQAAFAHLGRDLDLSGFSARLSIPMLQPGVYRLGILYADRESSLSSVFHLTDRCIQWASHDLLLVECPAAHEG